MFDGGYCAGPPVAANWRGKPLGPLAQSSARVLPAAEADDAYAVLKENYTLGDRLFEGVVDLLPIEIVYVEVVPTALEPA
jgi:hypothetical protein